MKKILFCLLLLPCLIQAQRLTVDSVLLKKQGVIPAKWVSVKTFSNIDTINEIQTLYNHNLYDLKNVDTTTRTKILTRKATDSLINYALTGTVDTKGNWDASGNTLPSTSVKTGDKWTISVKGFVSPDSFYVGDVIIAKIDDPGQTVTNWNHIYASQPKSVNLVLAGSSQVGALKYNGRVAKGGAFHGGNIALITDTSYLNFNGTFRSNAIIINSNVNIPVNINGLSNLGLQVKGVNTGIFSEGAVLGIQGSTVNGVGIRGNATGSSGIGLRVNKVSGTNNIAEFQFNSSNVAYIDYNGKGTFNGGVSSTVTSASFLPLKIATVTYSFGKTISLFSRGTENAPTGDNAIAGYFTNVSAAIPEKDTASIVVIEGYRSPSYKYKNDILNIRLMKSLGGSFTHINRAISIEKGYGTGYTKIFVVDSSGYAFNYNPTFSSIFYDSTRVIELDVNTPKIISNTWGNLWPNSVLVGFTENKDTAIVGYTGNYNMTFDFNCNVSVTASFRYHVKKRPANSTTVTTIYRKEVSNAGTTVNRAMSLNSNFSAGDRVWLELENITNGTDVTVYGGAFAITANYLNP